MGHESEVLTTLGSREHALIGAAAKIPIGEATSIVSWSPIVLRQVPGGRRPVDLEMKISAPTKGTDLPIILLSHGQGHSNNLSSLRGYSPLVDFWAAQGFVVIQPTHLSSRSLMFPPGTEGAPMFWRERVEDMKCILDQLGQIEEAMPVLKGRLDKSCIAVVGHSMGGNTAGLLLGETLVDPDDGMVVHMSEPRIKAGVLLAPPGNGGADLSPFALEHLAFMRQVDFAGMKTPALVFVGDDDDAATVLSTRGPGWVADAYRLSNGPKSLVTLVGGKHILGGISGYDVEEAKDESPERVALVQRLTWAYLRSTLYPEDDSWSKACVALKGLMEMASVESKN